MTCPNCGNEVADFMKFCQRCGAQMAATPYAPPQAAQPAWSPAMPVSSYGQPPKSKSGVGKVLLIIGIIFVVLVLAIGAAVFLGARAYIRSMKNSEPYALAESTLRESPVAKERLGEIKSIGMPLGTYKEEADGSGFAAFTMAIEGERASGQYVAALLRRKSVWRVQKATLKLMGGEEVNITDERNIGSTYEPDNDAANLNQNTEPVTSSNSNAKAKTVSGGVLNGKAIELPEPAYPPAAKAARAEGTVVVQVTIDEEGQVTSAKAVSGHPLLQASAVAAARKAIFKPTMLSGQPVKVTGTINYNFKLE
ncbi:MAG: TonB family protein [Acidobacteria bacterium]|nr:TonB family protein [Acidobacteriota bacterium]